MGYGLRTLSTCTEKTASLTDPIRKGCISQDAQFVGDYLMGFRVGRGDIFQPHIHQAHVR